MKQGRNRSLSICLTDIDKDRIFKHTNGKLYLMLNTYDYDEPDQFDNDFSVSHAPTKEEIAARKAGEKVNRIFLGNGRIYENNNTASDEEKSDLPF